MILYASLLCAVGGVNAAETAEASSLKALLQLHTSAPAKQRVVREKRVARSMLQDAQDTLLQSLAITSQSGLDQTVPHLVQLHCLAAVQETLPPVAPNSSDVDAPPGFAPKVVEVPLLQTSMLTRLWPFSDLSNQAPWSTQAVNHPADNPEPMLKLLRVHQHLKDNHRHDVQQRLRLATMHAASASHNYKLATRLVADVQAGSLWWCSACLRETQTAHERGKLDTNTAVHQLGQILESLQNKPAAHLSSVPVQVLLQLAKWSAKREPSASTVDANLLRLVQQLSKDHGVSELSTSNGHTSSQETYLHAAISIASQSAIAWLAYADYLNGTSQHNSSKHAVDDVSVQQDQLAALQQGRNQDTEASTESDHRCSEALQAYCRYLVLGSQSKGSADAPEDNTAVLLKVLQLASTLAASAEMLTAATEALHSVPQLLWRAVVPQLFALLAHEEDAVSKLAQGLLQDLGSFDAATVLYPALVESKRVDKGRHFVSILPHMLLLVYILLHSYLL